MRKQWDIWFDNGKKYSCWHTAADSHTEAFAKFIKYLNERTIAIVDVVAIQEVI